MIFLETSKLKGEKVVQAQMSKTGFPVLTKLQEKFNIFVTF